MAGAPSPFRTRPTWPGRHQGVPPPEDPGIRARREETEADQASQRTRDVTRRNEELDYARQRQELTRGQRDLDRDYMDNFSMSSALERLSQPLPREAAPVLPPRIGNVGVPLSEPPPPGAAGKPSLAFSRAKDVSGRIGNQAIRALKDQMSSRGMGGSGQEGELTAGILSDVGRYQSEAELRQAMTEEERAFQRAMAEYQGGITQRGQDLGFLGGNYGGNITQRGQDYGGRNDAFQILQSLRRRY